MRTSEKMTWGRLSLTYDFEDFCSIASGFLCSKAENIFVEEYRVEPLPPGSQAGEKEEALESSSSFLRGLPSLSSPTFYIFYSLVVRSVFFIPQWAYHTFHHFPRAGHNVFNLHMNFEEIVCI